MKHIKKWCGITLATILLSCQTSPVYAKDYKGSAVPIPTASYNNVGLQLAYCESLAEFSATAMDARQASVTYDKAVKSAPKITSQVANRQVQYLRTIIDDVYTYPVLDNKQDKVWLSEQYSKLTYLECVYK